MKTRNLFIILAAVLGLQMSARAADSYTIDPAHTRVGFSVPHLGITHVKGRFREFNGSLVLEGDALKEATATIQVQSVDTGVAQRDNHLRTADFFDATNYPTITFKTKEVENSGKQLTLVGDFTMRGVTKEIRLPVSLSKPIKDPWGKMRVGLEGRMKLNRKDYGLRYNQLLETGIPAVGDDVELEITAEAVKETGTENAPAK
jgi:polyisoprenoid-binding protein YceI